MTTRELKYCDACPATVALDRADRWGILLLPDPNSDAVITQDLCPGCIAKVHGWANPIVMGTGRRVFDDATIRIGPTRRRRPIQAAGMAMLMAVILATPAVARGHRIDRCQPDRHRHSQVIGRGGRATYCQLRG